jgi:hypothetical protein
LKLAASSEAANIVEKDCYWANRNTSSHPFKNPLRAKTPVKAGYFAAEPRLLTRGIPSAKAYAKMK